jgi:ankyrin repeat protein
MSGFDLWAMVNAASSSEEMAAARRPNWIKSIELVLNLPGTQVDIRGGGEYENCTPLNKAVCHGDLDITKLLLKYGANPNEVCGGETALLCVHKIQTYDNSLEAAYQITRLAIASELLKHNANINATNSAGRTALYLTTYEKIDLGMFLFLLTNNADVSIGRGDRKGSWNYTMLENLFGANPNTKDTMQMKMLLLERGADINEIRPENYQQSTLLHDVVRNRHYTSKAEVSFLIQNGVLDLQDREGETASSLAFGRGDTDLAAHIDHEFEMREERYLALAMGTHDRLGEASHTNHLTADLMRILLGVRGQG